MSHCSEPKPNSSPRLVVIMGVSGTGKSSVAARLATRLGFKFVEADDYHSEANLQAMASGRALTDEMREPWIETLCCTLRAEHQHGHNCVFAYSGLKFLHRERFRQLGFQCDFVWLTGDPAVISQRLKLRKHHFMSPSLLASQLDALEVPQADEKILRCDIDMPLNTLVSTIENYVKNNEDAH